MAGICFGLVGDGEPVPPSEPSSSVRRILAPPTMKSFAEVGVKPPDLMKNGRNRQMMEIFCTETDDDYSVSLGSSMRRVENEDGEEKAENGEFPKFGLTSVWGRSRDMDLF